MAKFGDGGDLLKCSFCGKSQKQVKKLIAGPGVYICDECIDLCNEIIEEELSETSEVRFDELPKPREIYEFLNDYIIGQDHAKKILSVAVYNHYKRVQVGAPPRRRRRAGQVQHPAARPHRLRQDAAGPDAGPHAQRALRHRRRHRPHRGRLRRRGRREHPPQADPGRRLRRQEGRDRHHLHRRDRQDRPQEREPVDHPRRLGRGRAAGAAQDPGGHHRLGAAPGGPQAPPPGVHPDRHHQHPVHLRRGLRRHREDHREPHRPQGRRLRRRPPPLATRRTWARSSPRCCPRTCSSSASSPSSSAGCPSSAPCPTSTRRRWSASSSSPRTPWSSSTAQFFEFDDVELEFTDDALEAVAEQALLRGTGARGLRAILEEVLLDVMYDLPSRTDIGKCVIDRSVVLAEGQPHPGAPHRAEPARRPRPAAPPPSATWPAQAGLRHAAMPEQLSLGGICHRAGHGCVHVASRPDTWRAADAAAARRVGWR